jgi:hypothetical protein
MDARTWKVLALGCALAALGACSDDAEGEGADAGAQCDPGEAFDPILGRCLRGTGGDAGGGGGGGEDAGGVGEDTGGGGGCVDTVLYADRDGDGAGDPTTSTQRCVRPGEAVDGFSREAGDCDDEDRRASPGQVEVCDEADNDCDDEVNEDLTCAFYAHTDRGLYLIDPFKLTETDLGATPVTLFDMDTHPDGTLYGAGSGALYSLAPGATQWQRVGSLGSLSTPNGMAISSTGEAIATGGAELYTIDVSTGATTSLGRNSDGSSSSGDCVLDKGDTLFMSATGTGIGGADRLVRIDRSTRAVSEIGSIGVADVYGLTAAWGRLFGMTGSGQLIEIDKNTGAGEVLHVFPGRQWYGAASTPAR